MHGQLGVSYEELRSIVVAVLAEVPEGEFNDIRRGVAQYAAEKLQVRPDESGRTGLLPTSTGGVVLNEVTFARIVSVLWDLIIEGILRPGSPEGSHNLPHYHLTEFGRARIKDPATPYDPDGYLKRLREKVPDLDPVIITYVTESLHTFRIGCLLSSAITLGCASEKTLLLLIQAYTDALANPRKENFQKKTEGQMIRKQYEAFQRMLEGHLWALLPGEIQENLEAALTTIFNLFRAHRNEAGHPTGRVLAREEQYAHIVAFPFYARKVYEVIGWLKSNGPLS